MRMWLWDAPIWNDKQAIGSCQLNNENKFVLNTMIDRYINERTDESTKEYDKC